MPNIYLQNEPMTNIIAVPVEQKRPHEMLQTPWIILYVIFVPFWTIVEGPPARDSALRPDARETGETGRPAAR